MNGRLTLSSGTPVMTSAVSAATSIIYTPYVGRYVSLWNGSDFSPTTFSELSQALSDTTRSPAAAVASMGYDLFLWSNGGTVTLSRGPAWTAGATAGTWTAGSSARGTGAGSTALTRVNGILVNQYAITNGPAAGYGTYVGTICTDSSGATVTWNPGGSAAGGMAAVLNVWNTYNQVQVSVFVKDTTSSWSYTTASWRQADNSAGNRITWVNGLGNTPVYAQYNSVSGGSTIGVNVGLSLDASSTPSGSIGFFTGSAVGGLLGTFSANPGLGQHYLQAIEYGASSATFYGFSSGNYYAQLSATVGGM